MVKKKQLFKRILAASLAVLTAVSVVPTEIFAASEKASIHFEYAYDSKGNTIKYQQTYSHNGITCGKAGEARTRIYADGENAYCIQPGISLHTGDKLEKDASAAWNALSSNEKAAVNLSLLYGAQGNLSGLSGNEDEKVLATQVVLWEIVSGCRNSTAPYKRTNAKFFNGLCANGANAGVAKAYAQIVEAMEQHNMIAVFGTLWKRKDKKEVQNGTDE